MIKPEPPLQGFLRCGKSALRQECCGDPILGALATEETRFLGMSLYKACDFFGALFLNGLKMIIVPLIVSSIICGVSNLGAGDNLGRLGGKTIGFYMLSSLSAILVGLLLVNLLTPGIIDGEPAVVIIGQAVGH